MARFGKIDAVHCEIWVKGKIRAWADYPSKPPKKWWEMKPPIEGMLVNKYSTPYLLEPEYSGLAIRQQH